MRDRQRNFTSKSLRGSRTRDEHLESQSPEPVSIEQIGTVLRRRFNNVVLLERFRNADLEWNLLHVLVRELPGRFRQVA